MGLFIILGLLLGSGLMLLRMVLMVSGQLKGPVLQYYERYGDEETYFFPLPNLLMWLGFTVIAGGFALETWQIFLVPTEYIGAFLLFAAGVAFYAQRWVRDAADNLPVMPRWANTLFRNTTRHERRRLAYMWLRLPLRTRLLYNASNRAFFDWAELVIISTL